MVLEKKHNKCESEPSYKSGEKQPENFIVQREYNIKRVDGLIPEDLAIKERKINYIIGISIDHVRDIISLFLHRKMVFGEFYQNSRLK